MNRLAAVPNPSPTTTQADRDWAQLTARAPHLAATMRRYLIQLTTFLAPASVAVADSTLRQFAGWLVASTDVSVVAQIGRNLELELRLLWKRP